MPQASDKNLEIVVRYPMELPHSFLGDGVRVRQVLTNLVGNAIKFTEQGHILIDVSVREGGAGDSDGENEADAPNQVTIRVEDTGVGIEADKIDKVFEKFTQADNSTTRIYGGTGLGLSISKRLTELMGGEIGVESELGRGSVFTVALPLEPDRSAKPVVRNTAPLKGKRALIVDDIAINRRLLSEQLAGWGMSTRAVSDGMEALDTLRHAQDPATAEPPFDICLMDYLMPGMNGLELASMVHAQPAIDLPVLMLSSCDQSSLTGDPDGIDGYLVKPVREQTLYDNVLGMLFRAEAPEANAEALADEVMPGFAEPEGSSSELAEMIAEAALAEAIPPQDAPSPSISPEAAPQQAPQRTPEGPPPDQLPTVAFPSFVGSMPMRTDTALPVAALPDTLPDTPPLDPIQPSPTLPSAGLPARVPSATLSPEIDLPSVAPSTVALAAPHSAGAYTPPAATTFGVPPSAPATPVPPAPMPAASALPAAPTAPIVPPPAMTPPAMPAPAAPPDAPNNVALIDPALGPGAGAPPTKPASPVPADKPSKLEILVAEDFPLNQDVVRLMLADTIYDPVIVENGQEAVDTFRAEHARFAAVLMDISMPIMDGYEATRLIRAAETEMGLEPLPIIALTGHALTHERQKCLDAGMNDYLTKPVKQIAMISSLDTHTGHHSKVAVA